jgi:polyisoprenoid-binding protein YceI
MSNMKKGMSGSFAYWKIAAALTFAAICPMIQAEELVRYKAQPLGSSVKVEGTSNIHDWTLDGNIVGGNFDVPSTLVLDSSKADVQGAGDGKIAAAADVSIPISSLKNGHWEGMDEVMQQAMNAENFPRIQYHLLSMTLKTPHAASTPIVFDTTGELSMNGVTNKISMAVGIETVETNKLRITSAAVPIKMTDYKVPPPVKMGVFRTEPDVKISFVWLVMHRVKPAEPK